MQKNTEVTRFIDLDEVFEVFNNDARLRKVLNTGKYVFVERLLVLNTEKFICRDSDGELTLTDFAWDNLSLCTIPFNIIHKKENILSTTDNFAPPKIKKVIHFDSELYMEYNDSGNNAFEVDEEMRAKFYMNVTLDMDCWTRMEQFVKIYDLKKYPAYFEGMTLLKRRYHDRILKKTPRVGQPQKEAVIAFSMAYNLTIPMANELLISAGRGALSDNFYEDRCYAHVLTTIRLFSMPAKVKFLYDKLGNDALFFKRINVDMEDIFLEMKDNKLPID